MSFFTNGLSFAVQNSGANYSFTEIDGRYRFELRQGDKWSGDKSSKERTELGSLNKLDFGVEYTFEYDFKIEAGAKNVGWTAIAQIHNTEDAADAVVGPPFELALRGDKLVVLARSDANAVTTLSSPIPVTLYEGTSDLPRDVWHHVKLTVVFDPFGAGHVGMVLNGSEIVDYHGALGYNDEQGGYFKLGIYRTTSQGTMVMEVKDFETSIDPHEGGITLSGTSSHDYLFGTTGDDSINGGNGNDHIYGGAGADRLNGGSGNDHVWGGAGTDKLYGGAGADTFHFNVGDGKDWVGDYSFAQGDRIELAAGQAFSLSYVGGRTIVDLGNGDQLSLDSTQTVQIGGDIYAYNGRTFDLQNGTASRPGPAAVSGVKEYYGTAGADSLTGSSGADNIYGGDGADRLTGGGGNDHLWGGAGEDKLYGGSGADTFHLEYGSGKDWIADYSYAAGDKIELPADAEFKLSYASGRTIIDIGDGDQFLLENTSVVLIGANLYKYNGHGFDLA